jgi:nucleoside-specific outer membrane channel protein Tsx
MHRLLGSALVAALLAAAPSARAGGFSTTNVQLLQGYDFDSILDATFRSPKGFDDGLKTTLTLNHFSTWEHGDSFFFADLTRGDITTFAGARLKYSDAYVEWHPRLFLNGLLGQKEPLFGFVRNWGLAGEVNQGADFHAYLGGLGLDLQVPGFAVLGLNVYYRYDNFNENGWQISPFWTVPFSIGPVPFVFTGFIDVNGLHDKAADQNGYEIWAQPELLVDVLAPFGGKAGKLHAGVEWWYHKQSLGDFDETSSVPQLMVQWTVF